MGETVEYKDEEYNVEVDNYYPGTPAYTSGLPEDCYPEELSEIEWHADTGDTLINAAIENDEQACKEIEEQLLQIAYGYHEDMELH